MNFSPFGGHFSTSIPSIHQFAAKFGQDGSGNGLCPSQESGPSRYPANSVPTFTQHHGSHQQHIMPSTKYQAATNYINQGGVYTNQGNIGRIDKRQNYDQHHELAQELCAAMLQSGQEQKNQLQSQNNEKVKQERGQEERHHQQNQTQNNQSNNTSTTMPTSWQSLATPGSTVADYLSHLPASTLPLSLHHFLKYSAENIKKETSQQLNINNTLNTSDTNLNLLTSVTNPVIQNGTVAPKKKKKKKSAKEKKPRPKPGEIRLTTALDGSTLYCCPECHMAYPEKELLEQHLVGHTLERRFVCDICGAGLKRKDHLTRHKQSHNPERPYVCTVCLKAFKRKEQLTLHFVIHSGEKRHICPECGKGFYRKDHLRKHTRSHIARRVKAELSQQGGSVQSLQGSGAISGAPTSTIAQALLS